MVDQQSETHSALELIFLRNEFYRKKFYVSLSILFLCLIGVFTLIGMLIYVEKHPRFPIYFAADPASRLLPSLPTNSPSMSMQEVTTWVIDAVQAAYSYDSPNYRTELQASQKYFTSYGWRNYMKGLSESNNLTAVKTRNYIAIARVVGSPKLMVQGLLGGAYAWKFRLQLLVTYWMPPYDEKSKFDNPLLVTVTVQRQDLLASYKGLGILQMNAELLSSPAASQNMASSPS